MTYYGTKSYTGEICLSDDIEVKATIKARVKVYEDAGCMYRRNGDPGDPPCYEEELVSYDVTVNDPKDIKLTPEQKEQLDDALLEYLEDVELVRED